MQNPIKITADHREQASGIPNLLLKENVELSLTNMKAGDYLLNKQLLIERKTKEDLILSLIYNRIFGQCKKLKQYSINHMFIIEGNPYKTNHNIKPEAIKGALLSISAVWQIPMFFTKNKTETVKLLLTASNQIYSNKIPVLRKSYKPKKPNNMQLYFLQGLPEVGPLLAVRLIEYFGTIKKISAASVKRLSKIEGIGKRKANKINDFFNLEYEK